ncbi:MAG: RecQ family ATP-dependent DNA helicase [Ignavibacteriales bacterium]|nr:RecQ family ATP-dependent DNA helicase [Ignavibacteriales bacterium]
MLIKALKKYYGFSEFREGQEEIIQAILDKKNVLGIMPTGAGKSLCYQLPSLLSESYSIIISPLISLMQDQVNSLNSKNQTAAFINSSLDYRDTEKVLNDLYEKKIKMLFIAPEKLNNSFFIEKLKQTNPEYLFVDEAHCISEWGHNFRPSYRNIKQFAENLNIQNISAFTATATPDVRDDIIKQLGFQNPISFVHGFERNNISLNVIRTKQKKEKIFELLKKFNTPTIIYAATRKNCEEVTEYLKQKKINAEFYHAGLTTGLRTVIQDDFIKNNIKVIVATNAFGMGIDKADIGMVIHYNIPGSLENLYQEFGRAGRNGDEAEAYLFYADSDKFIQEFLIKVSHPTIEQIKECYNAVMDFNRIAVNSRSEKKLELDEQLFRLIESKSINRTQFNSALQILENNKYLKLNLASQANNYIKFLLNHDQLKNYIKKLINAELKDFLITLVKVYGSSSFDYKIKIDLNYLQNLIGENSSTVENHLKKLDQIGIIEYEQPQYLPTVEMIQERVSANNLHLNTKEIDSKFSHANQKLDSVIEYSFTKDCRFKFILNYFGENVNNYKCGKCDNCKGSGIIDETSTDYISEMVLRTITEFKGGISRSRLLSILSGKSKSHIAKTISTYRSCLHFNSDQINDVISELLTKKLIKEIGDKIFKDPVEELIEYEKEKLSNSDYEQNLELFNKLREERNTAAKKFSQNPEFICSDIILRQLAKDKPTTPSLFLSINGVNQRMYNKIGLEFIEIIKENKSKGEIKKITNDLPKHIVQTYNLIKKKYSLTEIENLLKLSESIISLQIESIISYYPNENYSYLIGKEDFDLIKNEITELSEDIKEIKKRLPSKISYAKIRIVKAIISSSAHSPSQ